jgi:hypothetical protein
MFPYSEKSTQFHPLESDNHNQSSVKINQLKIYKPIGSVANYPDIIRRLNSYLKRLY